MLRDFLIRLGVSEATAAKDARKMEHTVGAADRASGVLPLLRQDPPQGAGDDEVLSRFLQSVRLRAYFLLPFVPFLCYTGAILGNTRRRFFPSLPENRKEDTTMRYEIKGTPFPVVICQLEDGEQMITCLLYTSDAADE